MIISQHSWHFRLYKWLGKHSPPDNLCGYFWGLVGVALGSLITFVLLAAIAIACFGVFVGLPIVASAQYLGFVDLLKPDGVTAGLIVLGLEVTLAIIASTAYALDQRKKRVNHRKWQVRNGMANEELPATTLELAVSTFKGWKEKHCTKIEFSYTED